MTREQQATLGQIAVWVGTAQELLASARQAATATDMLDVIPVGTRTAIARAAIDTATAARELTPLVKEAAHE